MHWKSSYFAASYFDWFFLTLIEYGIWQAKLMGRRASRTLKETALTAGQVCDYIESSIYPFIYPSIHSIIHLSIHLCIHSISHWFNHTHTNIHTYIHSFILCMIINTTWNRIALHINPWSHPNRLSMTDWQHWMAEKTRGWKKAEERKKGKIVFFLQLILLSEDYLNSYQGIQLLLGMKETVRWVLKVINRSANIYSIGF